MVRASMWSTTASAASGALQPHVSGHYPLDRAGEALRALMDRTAIGKVVVTP